MRHPSENTGLKRHGKWSRFSLRALLTTTALCGVGLGIWVAYFQPYHHERRLIAELNESIARLTVVAEPKGPFWLRHFSGGKYAPRVLEIHTAGVNNDHLAKLSEFSHLRWLVVVESPEVTDEGLQHLASTRALRDLMLEGTSVTNDGLSYLQRTRLEELAISSDNVTDEGLRHIGSLTRLRILSLEAPVTDDGMGHLKSLVNLEELRIFAHAASRPARSKIGAQSFFHFIEVPLVDVPDYIARFHGLPCRLDWEGLERVEVSTMTPLTIDQTEFTLEQALRKILDPLGLAWHWEGDGIVITDQEAVDQTHPGLIQLKQALPKLRTLDTDW
jgi:hypothetical protein